MTTSRSPNRDNIRRALLDGQSPDVLSRLYPRSTVFKIYDELIQSGHINILGRVIQENVPTLTPPILSTSKPSAKKKEREKEDEAEVVTVEESTEDEDDGNGGNGSKGNIIGTTTFDTNMVNRVRGILGIQAKPKVLSMPMPELLYPAMVIAVTEMGFPPMTPDNFIDTVLYQWLEACDYLPYVYIKKSELKELVMKHDEVVIPQEQVKQLAEAYIQSNGYMTPNEFCQKYGIVLPVNIDKEEEDGSSTKCTEPDSPQDNGETGE